MIEGTSNLDSENAVIALAALAQDTRLAVFRLLVRAGPEGMIAGDIAQAVGATPSTLSHHLGLLERAGLATSRRSGRKLFYAADCPGTRGLLAFLVEDCCQGNPDLCGNLMPASHVSSIATAPQRVRSV